MDIEDNYEPHRPGKKIRLKIVTNRNLQFITAVKHDATVSDLANRALSVYLELTGEGLANPTKKQLTVSAVKQGVYYMPKSEYVSSLLNSDDQVEVVIIKAKPKYPNQLFHNEEAFKKNRTSNPQPIASNLPPPSEKPRVPAVEEAGEMEQPERQEQSEDREKSKVGESSKRQKKKQKKRQKWQKKKQQQGGEKVRDNIQSTNHKQKEHEIKPTEVKEVIPESLPRKKVKLDQEVPHKSPDKPHVIVPSPKITFHQEPKIDSPRISIISESQKRKNFENLSGKLDGQTRKVSQDHSAKIGLQKIVSPKQSLKSPNFVHKTPIQVTNFSNFNEGAKGRQRQELSNFSLSRKGSDDRRGQLRPRKQNEENCSSANKDKHYFKEVLPNSIGLEELQPVRDERGNEGEEKKSEQRKGGGGKEVKGTGKSLVIAQPPSESDSQENKLMDSMPIQSSRFKQLAEIQNRIRSFMIDSGDEA